MLNIAVPAPHNLFFLPNPGLLKKQASVPFGMFVKSSKNSSGEKDKWDIFLPLPILSIGVYWKLYVRKFFFYSGYIL